MIPPFCAGVASPSRRTRQAAPRLTGPRCSAGAEDVEPVVVVLRVVHDDVAEARNPLPLHLRGMSARLRIEMLHYLADHEEVEAQRVVQSVVWQLLAEPAIDLVGRVQNVDGLLKWSLQRLRWEGVGPWPRSGSRS